MLFATYLFQSFAFSAAVDIYADPKAKKLQEVTTENLMAILSKTDMRAGAYELMDSLALV